MKKHILSAFLALALALTLFPATVTAASGASGGSYALNNVSVNGALVSVNVTASGDCALFVGLYDESGKMLDVRTENITGASDERSVSVQFNAEIANGLYARAFLPNPDASAPLCEGVDTVFPAQEYTLIERIFIETTADNVTAKTASVLGLADNNPAFTGANAEQLQRAYNQSKDPVGDGGWEPRARLRMSNGNRRTVMLDDSKNYRTSAVSDNANAAAIADAVGYDAEGYALDANGERILLSGAPGNDGNWIAEPFTAGNFVRVSETLDNLYSLSPVDADCQIKVSNFAVENHIMSSSDANGTSAITSASGTPIFADSQTLFALDDTRKYGGSFGTTPKFYIGIENAPAFTGYAENRSPTAYIYHLNGLAKLVMVYDSTIVDADTAS